MFHPVSFFIGLRYSRSQSRTGFVSFITFFSIIGVLLGVMALITVVSVMNGFEGELKKRILSIVPHVLVTDKIGALGNWQTQRDKLNSLEHVVNVTPIIEAEALVLSNKNLQGVLMQGIDLEFEQNNLVLSNLISGQASILESQPYSLILGQSLARKLDVIVGDKMRVVLPAVTRFTPMGRVPMQRTFTVGAIFNMASQVDDSVVYLHRRDAAKLLRKPANYISHLRLYLDDAFYAQPLVSQHQHSFPELSFESWRESQGTLFSAVKMEKNMMWLMLSLIIAVAAFNIVSALVMVVIDKQGEIAILQTFGMTRSGILKIFICQGVINGLWGVLLGVTLGVLLTLNLNDLMALLGVNILGSGYANQALPIDMQMKDVLLIAGSALLMSFVATLYPAYRASTTQPAEVLRNE